jgi:hypothetical protein
MISITKNKRFVAWIALLPLIPWICGDTPAVAKHPDNPNPAGITSTFMPDVNLTGDQLAAILGVYVWKFELTLPDGNYRVGISVLKQGKHGNPQPIGGLITPVTTSSPNDIFVALVPVDGTISDASRVRVVIDGLGQFSATTIDNPVDGMAIGLPQKPEKPDDLTYVLLGGYKGHTVLSPVTGNADRMILVNFQSQLIQPDDNQ